MELILWFDALTRSEVAAAGGKGANLGELCRAGLPVPAGFVLTADAFRSFVANAGLSRRVEAELARDPVTRPAGEEQALEEAFRQASMDPVLRASILATYAELTRRAAQDGGPAFVAVRSSATVEDAQNASFAGMFRSHLDVRGDDALVRAIQDCWASAFSERALFYRSDRGERASDLAVAVVVQCMIPAEKAGVMFTRDPTSADPDRLVVESNFGLGESVVGGRGTPDRYVVRKSDGAVLERAIADKRAYWTRDRATGVDRITELSPERRRESSLTDAELGQVVDLGRRIEALFGCAEDVEFAVENGRVFIVQARPMTATGKRAASATTMGEVLVRGLGASPGSASGAVRIVTSPARGSELRAGEVLVARVTTPDWVPFMRRASALVTDGGGMTSHAAIVARELGLPCVVGTGSATTLLQDGVFVTVDGREGVVRRGAFAEPQKTTAAPSLRASPSPTATRLYVNLAEPSRAEEVAAMEVDGVGLLRAEFLLLEALGGVHPRLLIEREQGKGFVERVAEGTRRIARAFFPRPVIYRAMDFRTNEFRALEGGERFEPHEENPTIGYRGCFRYTREPDLFGLELEMVRTVRAELKNLHVMIPFVRTAWELERCLAQMNAAGLPLEPGFERWIMAEVPSVVHWMRAYARLGITGVSIGSNDLTQLVLGVDRDSAALAPFFDERDEAVLATIRQILRAAQRSGLATGICGQAPSVHPGYADRLVRLGIDGISVSPDAIDAARRNIASAEQRVMLSAARRSRRRA